MKNCLKIKIDLKVSTVNKKKTYKHQYTYINREERKTTKVEQEFDTLALRLFSPSTRC